MTRPRIEQDICRVEVHLVICALSFTLFELVLHYIWRQSFGPLFTERNSIRRFVCIPVCLFVLSPLFILHDNFLLTQLYTSYGQFFRVYIQCYFIPMKCMTQIVLKSWWRRDSCGFLVVFVAKHTSNSLFSGYAFGKIVYSACLCIKTCRMYTYVCVLCVLQLD